MDYIFSILLFTLGLMLLIKGGDLFVDCALWFARRFRIPEMVIGATVVSIGTTLPEALVSATAAVQDNNGIAYGNAIGSIICNTALIAALVLLIAAPKIRRAHFFKGCMFFFPCAAVYITSAALFGEISRYVGAFLLLIFFYNMYCSLKSGVGAGRFEKPSGSVGFHALLLLAGGAALFIGSQLLVGNSVKFAQWLNVPEKVIGLTIVALGTSLPELTTAILSIRRGHGALSVGNVMGANFFNIVFVSGIASMISPIFVDAHAVRTDVLVMLFVMLVFTVPILIRGKGSRLQGAILLLTYALYVTALYAY